MIPITEEALQRMERRASDFSDGTQTDNPTAHQLVLHVLTLAGEVRRLRQELKDFGEHAGGCYRKYTEAELRRTGWTDAMLAARACTCGLDGAIG